MDWEEQQDPYEQEINKLLERGYEPEEVQALVDLFVTYALQQLLPRIIHMGRPSLN